MDVNKELKLFGKIHKKKISAGGGGGGGGDQIGEGQVGWSGW